MKLKAFSLKCRRRLGCPVSPLLFSIVLEVLVTEIRQGKKKKSYPNWEGGSEIVIINRWYDTIYGKS